MPEPFSWVKSYRDASRGLYCVYVVHGNHMQTHVVMDSEVAFFGWRHCFATIIRAAAYLQTKYPTGVV
jgi:hypothetical protein